MRLFIPSMFGSVLLMCCVAQVWNPVASTAPAAANDDTASTVSTRFPPPPGYTRVDENPRTFGQYLRGLPLKPAGAAVHLFNGELKWNQRAHAAVIDMSVGSRDLQQCADAVMRLRTEYLYSVSRQDDIAFSFTSGFRAEWKRWRKGDRIVVCNDHCTWVSKGTPDSSHTALMSYLQQVFSYAGTLSLEHELKAAPTDSVRAGDIFIQGGSPGHAVIVVDVAQSNSGQYAFMLAQSYMPAQDIHVLRNHRDEALGAWFILGDADKLYTPEWTFEWADLKRWP
ncbi:MAG: DUF4846 domain-containing protein [Flavobacteriales bacterium]|nr:DUF4846 domain-containing protein [Flavobacteriales bacterium]